MRLFRIVVWKCRNTLAKWEKDMKEEKRIATIRAQRKENMRLTSEQMRVKL